jgi:hypothetical protein
VQLVTEIQRRGEFECAVLVATTERQASYLNALIEAGATEYYLKPIENRGSPNSSNVSDAEPLPPPSNTATKTRSKSITGESIERRPQRTFATLRSSGSMTCSSNSSSDDCFDAAAYADLELRLRVMLRNAHRIVAQQRAENLTRVCHR